MLNQNYVNIKKKNPIKNPIIFSDYSDPDVIRVGDRWYMTASSFCNVPGLPILVSENLVDWQLIAYGLQSLKPEGHYRNARRGGGVWAPTIRHYDGRFSIWYPDPDFGIFKIEADNPNGPWTPPQIIDPTVGAIDPCPFIDQDGSRWMVKALAKSRAGINNKITLHRLQEPGDRVNDAGVFIIDGDKLPPAQTSVGLLPWRALEGPKLYRRGDWYYIFAPAGGVKMGWQAVFRARNLYGPWEAKVVMDQGASEINGPHQGAWVDAPNGSEWFLHFQDRDAWGRVLHLQPLNWVDDWPLIGNAGETPNRGEPVLKIHIPFSLTSKKIKATDNNLVVNSENSPQKLGLSWQWSANPAPDWFDETSVERGLRLRCIPGPRNPWENGCQLTRKIEGPSCSLVVKLSLYPQNTGEQAGVVVVGYACRWFGLRKTVKGIYLVVENFPEAADQREKYETDLISEIDTSVWLKVEINKQTLTIEPRENDPWKASSKIMTGMVDTSWSIDGENWQKAGNPFFAKQGRWVGTQLGFSATALFGSPASTATTVGFADITKFSWFVKP